MQKAIAIAARETKKYFFMVQGFGKRLKKMLLMTAVAVLRVFTHALLLLTREHMIKLVDVVFETLNLLSIGNSFSGELSAEFEKLILCHWKVIKG